MVLVQARTGSVAQWGTSCVTDLLCSSISSSFSWQPTPDWSHMLIFFSDHGVKHSFILCKFFPWLDCVFFSVWLKPLKLAIFWLMWNNSVTIWRLPSSQQVWFMPVNCRWGLRITVWPQIDKQCYVIQVVYGIVHLAVKWVHLVQSSLGRLPP